MSTKDSSCLQGKEGNASVAFNHIVCMEDTYSGWSRVPSRTIALTTNRSCTSLCLAQDYLEMS